METTVVDLHHQINDVLKALDRNEVVKIRYRGKIRGIIKSTLKTKNKKVCEHPFFNSCHDVESVEEQMNRIRGGRYSDI
jgi:hypothetical protein